jgi:hypothetical protein
MARRYTRAYAEGQAKLGNPNEPVATTIYVSLPQLQKVERLIEKRQREESEKLGRKAPRMSVTDFFRVLVDELPESESRSGTHTSRSDIRSEVE